jgi:hypothetical protein
VAVHDPTMRLVLIVCILIAGAVPAAARVMMVPPIQRYCRGPAPWTTIAKCVTEHGGLHVPSAPSQIALIDDGHGSVYFYLERDHRWQHMTQLRDLNYELMSRQSIKLPDEPGIRIDLRHRAEIPDGTRRDLLTEKVALICNDASCHPLVYACTLMSRGRAIETFQGKVVIDNGRPKVVGDRSQIHTRCFVSF